MPPILDRTNYDDWRTKMIVFFRSIDIGIWKVVCTGWSIPTIIAIDGIQIIKEKDNWIRNEHELGLRNSKALKAILGGVDQKMFKLINKCTTAKEAWEIMKTTHEGPQRVKDDQDPYLKGNDVAPNIISEATEIGKMAVKISETLVEESVTLCAGNTLKTTFAAPRTGNTVADTAEVPSSKNLVESVVPSVDDTTEEVPRREDVVPPAADTMHINDPTMEDVETDVTTSVGSNDDIGAGNSSEVFVPSVYDIVDNVAKLSHIRVEPIVVVGIEDTLNDFETEMHIPNYTAQEKKKKLKKMMHKGGAKENIDAAEIKGT
ncbi:hypothetical protein LIER_03920 [Lithospermum erythrorhizon]|uniref:DUF4219 domain-containing protein n=1 Tax=Lithospermum erythrorhizon TaxID=34254 RepID=A0AAV3NV21_LITER